MCGITGFLDPEGLLGEADLRRMNATISRRGPDGEGYYLAPGVGLAMRRLAIIDINGGWQPVYNEARTIAVVFNGEIYNFRELRAELEGLGHRFRTHSDSEVIAHLYERYGEGFAARLRGMFGIAIWDTVKKQLVLSRDRFGIKPLYVARVGRAIIFGSELKAVMASGRVDRKLDWQAVDHYFAYTFIPAPFTIYSGVRKFPTAHTAVISQDGAYREQSYWSLPPQTEKPLPAEELEAATERALLAAVESHMVSDVPVGAFLSGGVDSSIVVAMMTKFAAQPVKTFTVGFTDAGERFIDERGYARELAQRYKLDHQEIQVTPRANDILDDIVDAFDEPFADDSVVPSYYVSQETVRSVKVAMTGLGGDELFAGYKRHLGVKVARFYQSVPAVLRKGVLDPLIRRVPESARFGDAIDHLKRFSRASSMGAAAQYQDYMITLPRADRLRLYDADAAARITQDSTEHAVATLFDSAGSTHALEKALRSDIGFYLPDDLLALSDRISMWHSLELRVPFLDHPFVEHAANVPAGQKISGFTQKHLLRKIARRWVPDSILDHRKQGFEAPMGAWLRGPLLPLFDSVVNSTGFRELGVFNQETVRTLRDDHVAGRRKNSKILFATMMFGLWAARNGITGAAR
jgi:asparagine synthase (glutamine-hydrolysing)